MRITDVTVTRRKNLGNYEHEEVSISAALDEGECASTGVAQVKQEVMHALGLAVAPVKEATKKSPVADKVTKTPEETPAEEPAKPAKKAPAKKKAAAKPVPYNRDEKSHKTEFAKILVAINPNWKKECAAAAKEASVALHGEPMMDNKGKILDEFKAKVEEAVRADDL